jgi:hypothetical protein
MNKKRLTLLPMFLLLAMVVSVNAQVTPTFSATPNNSNIIQVVGTGFNNSEPVTLQLYQDNNSVYSFPNLLNTSSTGNFSAVIIVPTSISGDFNLTASTSNITMTVPISVPDLTGQQGIQGLQGNDGTNGTNGINGINGTNGIQGPMGIQGLPGMNGTDGVQGIQGKEGPIGPWGTVALAISLIAVGLVLWTWPKRKEVPQ